MILLAGAAAIGIPWLRDALTTVSTDDAYVNGHVTFVAPRVGGQVMRVLVDDNNSVRKGDLLVELDPEPFQVQVNIAQAAVTAAKADLVAAQASVRGNEGLTRSLRYGLQRAIEDVDDQSRHAQASRRDARIEESVAYESASRLQPEQAAGRVAAP